MTSIVRTPSQLPTFGTKFIRIESPSYNSSTFGRKIPFPFTYNNGTLDLEFIDDFEAIKVLDPDPLPDPWVPVEARAPDKEVDVDVTLMGGKRLVQRLGPNFETYIRAWRTATIDAGSPISIYIQPSVQKIQYTNSGADNGDEVYFVSNTPPTSDTYTIGSSINNYRTTWIFASPLTITTIEGGVTKYITLTSRLHED
jgi:hypothetical protein